MPIKRNVVLRHKDHVYIDQDGLLYKSMTSLLNDYKEPFNVDYWAKYKARERGVTKEQIIDEWNTIKNNACDKGSKVHNYIEDGGNSINAQFKGRHVEVDKLKLDYIIHNFPTIAADIQKDLNDGYIVYQEKIVYLFEFMLAGMIDYLAVNHKQKTFRIRDWKTNKDELIFEAGYHSKKHNKYIYTDKRLYYPINDMPDSKGSIYTLQLSGYAAIMEQWGYTLEPNGLELYHIRGDFDDNGVFRLKDGLPITHTLDYKKAQILRLFNYYKLKRDGKIGNNYETGRKRFSSKID